MSDREYVRFQLAGVSVYVTRCVSDGTLNARGT